MPQTPHQSTKDQLRHYSNIPSTSGATQRANENTYIHLPPGVIGIDSNMIIMTSESTTTMPQGRVSPINDSQPDSSSNNDQKSKVKLLTYDEHLPGDGSTKKSQTKDQGHPVYQARPQIQVQAQAQAQNQTESFADKANVSSTRQGQAQPQGQSRASPIGSRAQPDQKGRSNIQPSNQGTHTQGQYPQSPRINNPYSGTHQRTAPSGHPRQFIPEPHRTNINVSTINGSKRSAPPISLLPGYLASSQLNTKQNQQGGYIPTATATDLERRRGSLNETGLRQGKRGTFSNGQSSPQQSPAYTNDQRRAVARGVHTQTSVSHQGGIYAELVCDTYEDSQHEAEYSERQVPLEAIDKYHNFDTSKNQLPVPYHSSSMRTQPASLRRNQQPSGPPSKPRSYDSNNPHYLHANQVETQETWISEDPVGTERPVTERSRIEIVSGDFGDFSDDEVPDFDNSDNELPLAPSASKKRVYSQGEEEAKDGESDSLPSILDGGEALTLAHTPRSRFKIPWELKSHTTIFETIINKEKIFKNALEIAKQPQYTITWSEVGDNHKLQSQGLNGAHHHYGEFELALKELVNIKDDELKRKIDLTERYADAGSHLSYQCVSMEQATRNNKKRRFGSEVD
ncbi:uncharacterized protein IL334_004832 [Kwoniella shivajii]|uniref:Extracellular mutant protein 11 C-terminal domain-containing protein n=1 Tax=Kwoniella shivajii TaxID=564305 RepID=A0ABZ1D214_9TREE|nr:hypothetical protein IL334_004832 [Kwoniella shivajii]